MCSACAQRTLEALAPEARRCRVCDQPFRDGEDECKNPVCGMSQRWFTRNYAVSMRTGVLKTAINWYKFDDKRGWAVIFGRILVGYLDSHEAEFGDVGLIVASPAFTGEGSHRAWDHIRLILEIAAQEQQYRQWPFDLEEPAAVVKTAATPRMVGLTYQQRRANAEGPLRSALLIPDPGRVRGHRVLVFDDVFTDGLTLREVARALRAAGAAEVTGVSLARSPFTGGGR